MDHTKDHGAGGLSPRLGIQHQEPTSDSNEAVQVQLSALFLAQTTDFNVFLPLPG